ncbi:hypothetical protein [Peribacillus sp. SCS-155]|uniref:DUF7662 domain-containing protein n=1 Tax=Peribacillus sedimenti TaxID=3115297 RepID=UPI0039063CA7
MINKRSIHIQGQLFTDTGDIDHDVFLQKFMKFVDTNGLHFRGATSVLDNGGIMSDNCGRYDGKYIKLYDYLFQHRNCYSDLLLSFQEIESILQFKLPQSAYKYAAWWSNETSGTHSHARAWIMSGWHTSKIRLGESVSFVRSMQSRM